LSGKKKAGYPLNQSVPFWEKALFSNGKKRTGASKTDENKRNVS